MLINSQFLKCQRDQWSYPSVLLFDFQRTQGVWEREWKSAHLLRVLFNSTSDTHQGPAIPKSYFPAFITTLHLAHLERTTARQRVISHLWNKHQKVWSGASLLVLFALGQRSSEYCYTNCISLLRTCGRRQCSQTLGQPCPSRGHSWGKSKFSQEPNLHEFITSEPYEIYCNQGCSGSKKLNIGSFSQSKLLYDQFNLIKLKIKFNNKT